MLNQNIITTDNSYVKLPPRWLFLIILILMSTCGLVGSDVYLPTLPAIGKDLHYDAQSMQLTLGIYLLGLSCGQLLLGPLTDRFGRKKLLMIGMVLYLIASLACALATNYPFMLVARFFQALGACSGLIIGRAIIGDLYNAKEAGKLFSTIFPFVGASPAISPFVGGIIGYYFGWQATFLFVGLYAAAVAILTFIYLPETLSEEKRQPLHFVRVICAYPKLLIHPKFIAYVSAPCFAYIAYFAYIAQSPFIFHANGFGEREIGTFYITLSITYVLGNMFGKYLLNNHELNRVLSLGYIAFNFGAVLLMFAGLFQLTLYMMVLGISILTFGNGFLIPLGVAGVISSFSKSTGYASGLLGFLQLGVAALTTSLIGQITQNSIFHLGLFVFITTLIGTVLFFYFIKRGENYV